MARNPVQFQKGISLSKLLELYATEDQCFDALYRWRWPNGFQCPHCGHDRTCQLTTASSNSAFAAAAGFICPIFRVVNRMYGPNFMQLAGTCSQALTCSQPYSRAPDPTRPSRPWHDPKGHRVVVFPGGLVRRICGRLQTVFHKSTCRRAFL